MAPEMVNLTIDGKAVTVPKGTLLIEACAQESVYIPRFCYHEHLVPYAGCRMCLVQVEKMPKLATACSTPAMEGMVVSTNNDTVRAAREGMLEFMLSSHPLDCPVCDKGGECDLQDQAFLYGPPDSRMVDIRRFHQNFDLSSTIKLDYNRCILCKRCVRFTEEIGDDDRLIFRDRNAYTRVSTQTGEQYNSRFGGTVIEYCPVGALTDQVFRFRARPWELKIKASNCGDCAMGCATELQVRAGEVVRIFNREKSDLNGYYICDKGRFGHEFKDHPERLTQPMVRKNGQLTPVSWEEALTWAGKAIAQLVQADGPHSLAGIIGAERSLEDLANFRGLIDGLEVPHLDHWPSVRLSPAQGTTFLNRVVPFQQVVDSKHLLLFDCEIFDDLPMLALRLKQSRVGMVMTAWGPHNTAPIRSINAVRSYHSRYEWVNETVIAYHAQAALLLGIAHQLANRTRLSMDLQSALKQASDAVTISGVETDPGLIEELANWLMADDAVLAIGSGPLLQDAALMELLELVIRIRESARNKPLALCLGLPAVNSSGALALGVQPRWDKRGPVGADAAGIFAKIATGDLRGLILADGDYGHRLAPEVLEGLDKLQLFIASSFFLDEVTQHADCVFPALTWYESTGLTLNAEGRLQEITRGARPLAHARPIHAWCADLALHCNLTLPVRREEVITALSLKGGLKGAAQVTGAVDEWRHALPDPLPAPEIRHISEAAGAKPAADQFRLLPRRPFWVPGTKTDHSEAVDQLVSPWQVRLNQADGRQLGLKPGDHVSLATASGHLTAPVLFSRGIPQGYVDVEAGHREGRLAVLGNISHGLLYITVHKAAVPASTEEVAAV